MHSKAHGRRATALREPPRSLREVDRVSPRMTRSRCGAGMVLVLGLGCTPASSSPWPSRPVEVADVDTAAPREPAPAESAGSPFRVVARGAHGLMVARLGEAPVAVIGHVLADISADAIRLRPDRMAGLEETFGPLFRIDDLGGRWPDAAFLAAQDTFNGDLFAWRNDRWTPLHPERLEVASGGYVESWQVDPWLADSVLALHRFIVGYEFEVVSGVAPEGSSFPPAAVLAGPSDCRSAFATLSSAQWTTDGEVFALGRPCSVDAPPKISAHWSPTTGATVQPLPGLTAETDISAALVRVAADELFLVGSRRGKHQLREGYLVRWGGDGWIPEDLPAGAGDVRGLAPGDGRLYLTAPGRLWRRAAQGVWSEVALPDVDTAADRAPLRIDGMWRVDGATWIGASLPRPQGRNDPARHLILHDGDAVVPDAAAIDAVLASIVR